MPEHLLTDEILRQLLNKEWLVKIDNTTSLSYLFKFGRSSANQCYVLVTDTIGVWYEVFDSKYLIRRWRSLNGSPPPSLEPDEDLLWRRKIAQNLSEMHTPSAIQGSSFSIEESSEADLAIELHDLNFGKWRWECFKLGYKTSAALLSTHLFFPLLTATHLAFTSADSLSELSKSDLEEAVDNVARAGRRTQAIFIRQTFSRPRIATSLSRLSAMLNFIDFIPPIQDNFEEPADKDDGLFTTKMHVESPDHGVQEQGTAPEKGKGEPKSPLLLPEPTKVADAEGSTTEPESDNDDGDKMLMNMEEPTSASKELAQEPEEDSRAPSPPAPPMAKKIKTSVTDNEEAVAPSPTSRSAVPTRKVGVRQPIKRGGKRF